MGNLKRWLTIAFVGLVIGAILYVLSMYVLGGRIKRVAQAHLQDIAEKQLEQLTQIAADRIALNQRVLEHAIRLQAAEVEERIFIPSPTVRPVYFEGNYHRGLDHVEMSESELHRDADGNPMKVAFGEQVAYCVENADDVMMRKDAEHLSTMPEAYSALREAFPKLMIWQYTGLDSGLYTCYPGHRSKYGENDYDHRTRAWYTKAKGEGRLTWHLMGDISTGTLKPAVAIPVKRPNGDLVGVTAIDVPFLATLGAIEVPAWAENHAEYKLVMIDDTEPEHPRLKIWADQTYDDKPWDWKKPSPTKYLESPDQQQLNEVIQDLRDSVAGIRTLYMDGNNIPCIWAYAGSSVWIEQGNEVYLIVTLPSELVGLADQLESIVREWIFSGLVYSLIILFAVVLAIVFSVKLVLSRVLPGRRNGAD